MLTAFAQKRPILILLLLRIKIKEEEEGA